jgi:hypothetical protein
MIEGYINAWHLTQPGSIVCRGVIIDNPKLVRFEGVTLDSTDADFQDTRCLGIRLIGDDHQARVGGRVFHLAEQFHVVS